MASLVSLPAELKLSIIEHLDLSSTSFIPTPSQELLSLSQVCKALRTLTLPFLLQTITLLNEEKSGSSVLTILNSAHAEHVRHVHYIGIKAMPAWVEANEEVDEYFVVGPSLEDFPDTVEQALSNLAKLKNLERVVVEFRCAKNAEEDDKIYKDSYNIFEDLEADQGVLESERKVAFRSVMERSYRALARNSPCTIKHLELKNVVAKKCSAWNLPEFRAVLQSLTSFTISLRGGDNGVGRRVNKVAAYLDFVAELDEYFFEYLSNTKHLSFVATEDGPPGIAGGISNTSLPLLGKHMPRLQTLSLEYTFISGDLIKFITAHGDTLESVHLTHCYSGFSSYREERNAIPWANFFHGISVQDMKSLRVFDIATSDIEQLHPRSKIRPKHYDHRNAVYAFQLRRRFPERRMLDYKILDVEYGAVHALDEAALFIFQDGDDHKGLECVRNIIKKNVGNNS